MLKELIVYFCDNKLFIVHNSGVVEKKLECINKGLVVDRTVFIENFLQIMKKEKIKSKLFGDKIYIVNDAYYNERDRYYLESIFLELGFVKVSFINVIDFFDKNYTYIGVFKDYIVFYLNRPLLLDLDYFKDLPKLIGYFHEYYQKHVILFGSNKNIPLIKQPLVNIYYVDNYQNYILENLLKVKKYGV